jgi:hypothetical protein
MPMPRDHNEFANLWFRLREPPPYWPPALTALIDAMRDYLWADEAIAKELLREGSITREQYDKGMAVNAPLVAWLKKMEAHPWRDQARC